MATRGRMGWRVSRGESMNMGSPNKVRRLLTDEGCGDARSTGDR